jgi:aryl-alcohol dehydrogenase-like predicted oxidoreductase
MEATLLPYCREHDIAVLAYSPLAQGLLTGKVSPERVFADGDLRKGNPRFSAGNIAKVSAMLDEFSPIAERHGVTLAELAIAWTFSQPGLTHVLVGARNADQARENAVAGELVLTTDELVVINEILDRYLSGVI